MTEREQDQDSGAEYQEFIRQSVESGNFFRDSFDWYIFRYVGPLCDRTWLFFTTIVCAAIVYTLSVIIINSLPIVQKVPVVIKAKDPTLYYPTITPLRDSEDLKTIEEAVIKYLALRYLKEREEYDFTHFTTAELNKKFNIIKNNSTPTEFNRFKSFISLSNQNSPIRYFGKNVVRQVEITSFDFVREVNENFISKAKNFVYIELPSQAEIGYTLTTIVGGEKKSVQKYVAKIVFRFSTIDNKNINSDISFKVSDYNLFVNNRQ